MNACLLVLCLTLGRGPERQQPDRLFGEDKLKHFFTSFVITSVAASGARLAGLNHDTSLMVGAGVGAGVGVAKEMSDLRNRPRETPSLLDLAWDLAGVGAATAVVAQTR